MKTALVFLALLLVLPACSSDDGPSLASGPSDGCHASKVSAGEATLTLRVGGKERSYLRHVPPAATPDHAVPLVLDFHGYLESPEIHENITRMTSFGDEHGFVTVAPRGRGDPLRWDTSLEGADMTFVRRLIDHVENDLCIDRARVFATGLSNGAQMTSSVGCALADRVAAIAPVAGIRYPEDCKPSRAVPVLAIHGTADRFISYDGGLGEAGLDLPAPDGSGRKLRDVVKPGSIRLTPIPKMAAAWAHRDGCEAEPATVKVASDVDRIGYDCPEGVDVQLYRIDGGGHAWPGSPVGPALESIIGKTTTSISANEMMWRFFQRHPMPAN